MPETAKCHKMLLITGLEVLLGEDRKPEHRLSTLRKSVQIQNPFCTADKVRVKILLPPHYSQAAEVLKVLTEYILWHNYK